MSESVALTRGGIKAALAKLDAMKSRAKAMAAENEVNIGRGFQLVESVGASAGWGFLNAKYGKDGVIKIMGLDADLAVGLLLIPTAIWGMGKHAEHGINLAAGSLGAYSYRLGQKAAAPGATLGSVTGTGFAPAGSFQAGYAPAGAYAAGYAPAGDFQPQR